MKKLSLLAIGALGLVALGCGGYNPDGTYPDPAPERSRAGSMPWRFQGDVTAAASDEVERPTVMRSPVSYTESARKQRITGAVTVEVMLDAAGTVTDVVLKQSLEPSLDENVRQAAWKWKYTPARLNGVAMPSVIEVTANFMVG